jgi:hypothetical protein
MIAVSQQTTHFPSSLTAEIHPSRLTQNSRTLLTFDISQDSLTLSAPEAGDFVELLLLTTAVCVKCSELLTLAGMWTHLDSPQ